MKIQTITYMERKNLGNYEHAEISATAQVLEGEDEAEAVLKLMEYVGKALNKEIQAIKTPEVVAPTVEVTAPTLEVEEKPKKSKKTAAKKAVSNYVAYNRELEAHRQLLSSHLTSNYPNWKTKEGVKEFSSSLVGKEFLDEAGYIIDSFKEELNVFFA